MQEVLILTALKRKGLGAVLVKETNKLDKGEISTVLISISEGFYHQVINLVTLDDKQMVYQYMLDKL